MDCTIYNGLMAGIALLLISAVVTPLFAGNRKLAGGLNFLFSLLAGIVFTVVSFKVLTGTAAPETYTLTLGSLNIPFLVDGFSALFLGLISLMAAVTAFYCIGYMEMDHYRHYSLRSFFVSYPIFVAGMIGIVTVDDLTTGFTIAWQMMTLASFFLIRFDHEDKVIVRNANKYLILMELAWVLVVVGALLIPGSHLGAPLHELAHGLGIADAGQRTLILALILLGFGMKAGMFPLGQLWLPDAHSVAPSPISAMLSGVMIKTGVYGILRTLFWMTPENMPAQELLNWGMVAAAVGVLTLFIGTAQAVKQVDAKRLHAYSSIGQIGYILMAIGCARYFMGSDVALHALALLALFGAIAHTLNHAVFKGLLFLCTGSVQYTTGTKDLDKLGGLFGLMPVTAVIAGIAAIAVAGVPAFSGFTSKWAIVGSSLLSGKAVGIFVMFGIIALVTSAMTLATYVKFYGMTFTSVGVEWNEKKDIREVSTGMLVPKLILVAVCLIQGLFPFLFVQLFGRVLATSEGIITKTLGTPEILASLAHSYSGLNFQLGGSAVAFSLPLVMIAVLVVAFLFASWLRRAGGSETRTAPVWLCGYQTLGNANRYAASHIFDAFKKFMKWTGGNVRT